MIKFPQTLRFRYLLATPTVNRGSEIRKIDIVENYGGWTYQFIPERILDPREFKVLSTGFESWAFEISTSYRARVTLGHGGAISYLLPVSFADIFQREILDEEKFVENVSKHNIIAEKTCSFLAEVATTKKLCESHLSFWSELTTEFFKYSIPFLFLDEAILEDALSAIQESIKTIDLRQEIERDLLCSKYAKACVENRTAYFPDKKSWVIFRENVVPPPFCPVDIGSQNIAHLINSAPLARKVGIAFSVHQVSEQIHYVFGPLLFSGAFIHEKLKIN